MTHASMARRIGSLIVAVAGLALCAWPVIAQQSTPPAEPPKEEVPFWAIGRPQAGAGAQMAPVPAFPIPTAADKLPIAKMKASQNGTPRKRPTMKKSTPISTERIPIHRLRCAISRRSLATRFSPTGQRKRYTAPR